MVQNEKKFCLSCSISQESYIIWFWFLVCVCKVISPGVFFMFSKFWFSAFMGGRGGGKRVKNSPKWQKILLRLIAQEPYVIWLSFVEYKCKMILSWAFFFWDFDFLGCYKGQRATNGPRWQKTLSFALYISGTIHHVILIYVTCACVKGLYLQGFFTFFPNFKFWGQ